MAGLSKTVYNPAALKAVQKNTDDSLKKKQVRGEVVLKVWQQKFSMNCKQIESRVENAN